MRKVGKNRIALAAAAALLAGLTACGAPTSSPPPPVSRAGGTPSAVQPLHLAEEAGHLADLKAVWELPEGAAAEYNGFALRLMQAAQEMGKNGFVSPISVYLALAMTANGAAGNTRDQMLDALGAGDKAALNRDCRELQAMLLGRNDAQLPERFRLANGIWLADWAAADIRPEFLQTNREYFGARLALASFNDDLLGEINAWVAGETKGRIADLLTPPIVDDTVMILVNALLFEGEWQYEFLPENTTDAVFHSPAGDLSLPMMCQDAGGAVWYEDSRVQATRVPFYDGRTAMVLALPKKQGEAALWEWIASLDGKTLSKLVQGNARCRMLRLYLPRFSLGYKAELEKPLRVLGITDAFEENRADFTAMITPNSGRTLPIGSVVHQTRLEVSETGVLAAAATGVKMVDTGAPMTDNSEHILRLDRPFFCALVDVPTGAVIFGGAVCRPEALNVGKCGIQ